MKLQAIERDWPVFVQEGAVAVGAVRRVQSDHLIVYIEGYGDVRITPAQIASVHDAKVVLEPGRLDDALRRAVEHAHDHESRRSS